MLKSINNVLPLNPAGRVRAIEKKLLDPNKKIETKLFFSLINIKSASLLRGWDSSWSHKPPGPSPLEFLPAPRQNKPKETKTPNVCV